MHRFANPGRFTRLADAEVFVAVAMFVAPTRHGHGRDEHQYKYKVFHFGLLLS